MAGLEMAAISALWSSGSIPSSEYVLRGFDTDSSDGAATIQCVDAISRMDMMDFLGISPHRFDEN
jgi:hypothetical protein